MSAGEINEVYVTNFILTHFKKHRFDRMTEHNNRHGFDDYNHFVKHNNVLKI